MKKIEDLTEAEREELSHFYKQKYKDFFDILVKTMAELIGTQDRYGFVFVCETISTVLRHASEELIGEEHVPPTIGGWPTGTGSTEDGG